MKFQHVNFQVSARRWAQKSLWFTDVQPLKFPLVLVPSNTLFVLFSLLWRARIPLFPFFTLLRRVCPRRRPPIDCREQPRQPRRPGDPAQRTTRVPLPKREKGPNRQQRAENRAHYALVAEKHRSLHQLRLTNLHLKAASVPNFAKLDGQ